MYNLKKEEEKTAAKSQYLQSKTYVRDLLSPHPPHINNAFLHRVSTFYHSDRGSGFDHGTSIGVKLTFFFPITWRHVHASL